MPSNAGIVTDADGRRVIPESRRADGSIRPAIKVRPGYTPPEDVAKYRIPLFRRRAVAADEAATATASTEPATRSIPGAVPVQAPISVSISAKVPGAVPASTEAEPVSASSTAAKNAKRREARKKAAANSAEAESESKIESKTESKTEVKAESTEAKTTTESTAEDRDKKIRGLKKKLKQAKELQTKREGGESLLPEQVAKVIRISELTRELESLGLGDDEK